MGTNNADHPVALARAIWKGALRGSVEYSQVSVKDLGSQYWGGYDIPPKKRTGVSVDFMILPKILPTPGAEIRLDVGVIDQFGNTHWVKDVILRSA